MSQTPITVTYSLEEVLKQINGKLDILQKDVNDLKIGQVRLEENLTGEIKFLDAEVKGVKEDIKELKGSSKAQIWTLIGILITAVGGFLVPVGRLVISGNP
jgi:predicted  nucleic acid-binding Zn-ribbon protein